MALEKIEPAPQAQALLLRIRVKWKNVEGQLTFRWRLEPWPDECFLEGPSVLKIQVSAGRCPLWGAGRARELGVEFRVWYKFFSHSVCYVFYFYLL